MSKATNVVALFVSITRQADHLGIKKDPTS